MVYVCHITIWHIDLLKNNAENCSEHCINDMRLDGLALIGRKNLIVMQFDGLALIGQEI